MSEFYEDPNKFNVSTNSYDNQFQKQDIQIQQCNQQQYSSYPPLCLDSKCPQSRNTPISQLSQGINHSQLKLNNHIDKNWVHYNTENLRHQQDQKNDMEKKQQIKVQIKHLSSVLADLKCYTNILEKRNQQLVLLLQKEKLKSSHFEQALNIIRKQDQHLDKRINEQAELFAKLRQAYQDEKDKNLVLSQKLQQTYAQNNYLKQLILIANNNYEVIEKKYMSVVERNKKIEEQNLSKQKQLNCNMFEMKSLLTNIISSPSNHSTLNPNMSFGEQDQNLFKKIPLSNNNRNQKRQVEEIYRKMFIKTLKAKK